MGDSLEGMIAAGEFGQQDKRARHAEWHRLNMDALRASGFRFTEHATSVSFRMKGKPWCEIYPHTGRWRQVRPALGKTFRGGAKAFLAWYAKQEMK